MRVNTVVQLCVIKHNMYISPITDVSIIKFGLLQCVNNIFGDNLIRCNDRRIQLMNHC